MTMRVNTFLFVVLFFIFFTLMAKAQRAGEEIQYPSTAFAKLDTFESLNLQDADKLYAKGDFTGAYAAYKAYSFEFAKSPALPYVLLRMGRCLHLLGKRHAAVTAYQDVVDYFPDDVIYAAAALYYIGECHGQNGDADKQTAVWARMVKDDDYVSQPNSGTALAFLGKKMEAPKKFEEAMDYHWRTAVTFATSNERAAGDARNAVIQHYAVRRPNHEKLKAFYTETSAYGNRYRKGDKPEEAADYWQVALDRALRANDQAACRYWAGLIGNRFEKDDGLRLLLSNVQRVCEKDEKAWVQRLEGQFQQHPVSLDRVLQWLGYYPGGMSERRSAFFKKHIQPLAAGMKTGDKMNLMGRLRHPLQMHDEAKAVMRSIRTDGMSDDEIRRFAFLVAEYEGEDGFLRLIQKASDAMFATKCRYDYYWNGGGRGIRDAAKALAEIPALKKDPKYAGQDLVWSEGELLARLGLHEEAIKAYQAANRQPDSTWAVTDCLVAMKRYAEAIKNVQGLESVGGGVAAQAALKVADILKLADDKGKEVDQLRIILRRYPKSRESSIAHERLEGYGVKLVGGVAEAEE